MMGVFIQLNVDSPKGRACPIGYVIQESGCWDWVGQIDKRGYGRARRNPSDRVSLWAHRVMYERERDPIPVGHDCHHVCGNKACVNPDHIAIVTRKEHAALDSGYGSANRDKTNCKRGHPLAGFNLYVNPSTGGIRCRTCKKIWDRRYMRRLLAGLPRLR